MAEAIQRVCQDLIQHTAMIASDDNLPDDSMRQSYANVQIRRIKEKTIELEIMLLNFTSSTEERFFWEGKQQELCDE